MSTRTVTVGWQHPETEEEFRVRCAVTPGTPDRGPDFNCAGGYPGDPAEVEVLDVIEDWPGGASRPELIAVVERDFGRLEERALEAADEYDGPDSLEEARCER